MDFKNIIFSILVIGLFSLSLITFVYQMQTQNGVNNTIMNIPAFNKFNNSLFANLSTYQQKTQTLKNTTSNSNVVTSGDSLVFFSIFAVAIELFTLPITLINTILEFTNTYLQIPPIITAIFLSVISVMFIFGIWRLLRTGE